MKLEQITQELNSRMIHSKKNQSIAEERPPVITTKSKVYVRKPISRNFKMPDASFLYKSVEYRRRPEPDELVSIDGLLEVTEYIKRRKFEMRRVFSSYKIENIFQGFYFSSKSYKKYGRLVFEIQRSGIRKYTFQFLSEFFDWENESAWNRGIDYFCLWCHFPAEDSQPTQNGCWVNLSAFVNLDPEFIKEGIFDMYTSILE